MTSAWKTAFDQPSKSKLFWLLLTHSFHPICYNKRAIDLSTTNRHIFLTKCQPSTFLRPNDNLSFRILSVETLCGWKTAVDSSWPSAVWRVTAHMPWWPCMRSRTVPSWRKKQRNETTEWHNDSIQEYEETFFTRAKPGLRVFGHGSDHRHLDERHSLHPLLIIVCFATNLQIKNELSAFLDLYMQNNYSLHHFYLSSASS